MRKMFCVISHTHWDREWYLPFEQFRMKLVDLIDNLLEVLKNYPEYIFHLDAQTIVLEDYLEIRPYRRNELKEYIRSGNIIVGPWYVQNDFYLTSGEATIRNLLTGIKIAEEFGSCARVGYMPDQFGLMAQLPQILEGFDIHSCIFGRGYKGTEDKVLGKITGKRSEFVWVGPDGTRLLAVLMPFWYNNAQRFSDDINKSIKLLTKIEKDFDGIAMTPYLLLMNGVDHLEAQENLIPIMSQLNKELPFDKGIEQITMQQYIDKIEGFCSANSINSFNLDILPVYRGELRGGDNYHVLQGTLSSRIYLKQLNTQAQHMLENGLEPLYSFIRLISRDTEYPKDYMDYLWKLLIQNHPHDSICGCSRDEVHSHMEDRFARIFEASTELQRRGMDFITAHIDRESLSSGEYLLTAFNSLQQQRNEIVYVELQFPVEEDINSFKIYDHCGEEICFEIISRERKEKDITSPINLPGVIEIDSYKIRMSVDGIPGFSQRTYVIKKSIEEFSGCEETQKKLVFPIRFENEFLEVTLRENGAIDLFHRETEEFYSDVVWLEDREDCGDSYVYSASKGGRSISTKEMVPLNIKCINKTILLTEYLISYELDLPIGFDRELDRRCDEYIMNRIDIKLSLSNKSKWLAIDFDIDNKSRDHRLRAFIKTGIQTEFTSALEPFDVSTRDRREVLNGLQNGDQPNSGFVGITNGTIGMAVLNKGLYEYQHLLGDEGIVAVTLFRGNDLISKGSSGDNWIVNDNQCVRRLSCSMGIYPHRGTYLEGKVEEATKEFNCQLLMHFQPVDVRKFTGGRPAVQESDIKEIFYRADKYSNIKLPLQQEALTVYGSNIVVSSIKKAEKSDKQILRLYNSGFENSEATIIYPENICKVERVSLEEKFLQQLRLDSNILKVVLEPAEILTIAAY